MKRGLAFLLTVGLCFLVVSLLVSRRQAMQEAAAQAAWQKAKAAREAEFQRARDQARRAPLDSPPAAPEQSLPGENAPVSSAPPLQSVRTDAERTVRTQSVANPVQPQPQTRAGKDGLKDPLARQALSLVGADFAAEEVWAEAINNPELPPKERQDLIEDLNEDGFPDPKNITAEDLPLILSRIELIEQYGPNAMDEVNAAAFQEAYKDLLKMFFRLTQW